MSMENIAKTSNTSGSSSSSKSEALIMRDDGVVDLTLFGSPAPVHLSRTGTVRRAAKNHPPDDEEVDVTPTNRSPTPERYRRSLDSTYRLSLESISEHKAKNSFSSTSCYPSRECSSLESSSPDLTDCALRSTSDTKEDKTLVSPASSYLSWIESVHSEYFGSAPTTAEVADVDGRVGEWNNFWLNYNSARTHYLSSPYLCANEDRNGDEFSDGKSTCSTQREFTDKNSIEQVILSLDEISEAIKCSQRITDILQNALRRNENDFDDSKNESYYSQQLSQQTPGREEVANAPTGRERSYSYVVDGQDVQKQKLIFKTAPQSSSNSCINALLNTGVADILKRVITKRREVFTTSEDLSTVSHSGFPEWSSAK